MRTKNRPIEVLAPAGSMECLKAAILNGADAVYLGERCLEPELMPGILIRKNC